MVIKAATPGKSCITLRHISTNNGIVYSQNPCVVDPRAVSGETMTDSEPGNRDMGGRIGNGHDCVDTPSINDRRAGTRADHSQTFAMPKFSL
jgi:hypothetical protein